MNTVQSDEQLLYARWLEWGTRLGLGVLVLSFLGYAAGWLPALGLATWLAQPWPAARTALFTAAAGMGMVAAVRAAGDRVAQFIAQPGAAG